MIVARLGAAGLFVLGLGLGSAVPNEPHGPMRVGDGWMIAADFHVHAFPGDGVLAPWDLAHEASRQGLDAVAITNHNQLWATRIAAWLPRASGALVIPGDEVTAPRFHMTAIGIEHAIDWRLSLPAAADAVRAQGGAAILAHPAGKARAAVDRAAILALDGVEVAHPMTDLDEQDARDLVEVYAQALGDKPTIAPIGSTDFHALAPLGLCRTYVFATDVTQAAIVDAVRSGRTVACDTRGRTHGEPGLAKKAAAVCQLSVQRRLNTSRLNQVSLACTWLGLVGLVFFGFPTMRLTIVPTTTTTTAPITLNHR